MSDLAEFETEVPTPSAQFTVRKLMAWTLVAAITSGILTPWLREFSTVQIIVFASLLAGVTLVVAMGSALRASRFNRAMRQGGQILFVGTLQGLSSSGRKQSAVWPYFLVASKAMLVVFVVWMAFLTAKSLEVSPWTKIPVWAPITLNVFIQAFVGPISKDIGKVWFFNNGMLTASGYLAWNDIDKAYVSNVVPNQLTLKMKRGQFGINLCDEDLAKAKKIVAKKFPVQTAA